MSSYSIYLFILVNIFMPTNQELYGTMGAVESNIKQFEDTRVRVAPEPQYGLQIAEVAMKSAFMLAGDFAQTNNQNFQQGAKNIFDQKLGRDETIGKLTELQGQYKFAGKYMPEGRALNAQIDNYINNYKQYEAAGVDRMVEDLALNEARAWVNSGQPKNVINKELARIKDDMGKIVTTSLSSDFIVGVDAYSKFNDVFSPTLNSLNHGMGDVRNVQALANDWVNLETNKFMTANAIITPENLYNHIANISKGLSKTVNPNQPGQTKFLLDTIKNNASSLLSHYASSETLDSFININDETKSLFSVNEIKVIEKNIENRSSNDVVGTPEQRAVLEDARKHHAIGRPLMIDNPEKWLSFSPKDLRHEKFLMEFPLQMMSPEKIDEMALLHPKEFMKNYDLVSAVKEEFKKDAADNTQLLLAKRNIFLPQNVDAMSPNLPSIQYDDKFGVSNIVDIDAKFKKQLLLHKYVKEEVFVGASDISSPISELSRKEYQTFFKDDKVNSKAKFDVADVLIQNIDAYNKSILDPNNRIDPYAFISNVAGDGTLARQIMIQHNNNSMGFDTYRLLDSMEKEENQKTQRKLVYDSMRQQFDYQMFGVDMDTQTREAIIEIGTASKISKQQGLSKSAVDTMYITDIAEGSLQFETIGNQGIALVKRNNSKKEFEKARLKEKVAETTKQNPIVVNGKTLSFKDINGKYRLVQKPLDVNSFFLEIAPDGEKANKGIYQQALNMHGNPIIVKFGK